MIYLDKRPIIKLILIISILALVALIVITAAIGVADISFLSAMKIMARKIPFVGRMIQKEDDNSIQMLIVLNLRLPRIILASLVGATLSVVGAVLQGMFKNQMADPYVLGISSGASLGATIAIVLGLEQVFLGVGYITIFAFLGSIITITFVYNIARVGNKVPSTTLLLSGIAVSFMLSSMVSILMIFNRNQVEQIVFWIMGSVSAASWKQIWVIIPVVSIGIAVILAFSRELNVMSTGEETAKSLGIEVEKVKKLMILICSILVAACVSVSGIIGFLGLIIPHSVRLLGGSDHRTVIPFSIVGGAVFMVLCDTIARTAIPPIEIPVGAVTSIFGAPYFIYLLYRNKKKVF